MPRRPECTWESRAPMQRFVRIPIMAGRLPETMWFGAGSSVCLASCVPRATLATVPDVECLDWFVPCVDCEENVDGEKHLPEIATAVSNDPCVESPAPAVRPRWWPGVVIILLQWLVLATTAWAMPGSLPHFFSMLIVPLLAALLLSLWWLLASRVPWRDRLLMVGVSLVALVGGGFLVDRTLLAGLLFYALPTMLTAGVLALLLTQQLRWPTRRVLVALSLCLSMLPWMLLRSNGMDGSMNTDFAWRWSTTAEEQFLATLDHSPAQDVSAPTVSAAIEVPVEVGASDWAEFRGPRRDGVVRGVRFSADWAARPPKELWRHQVGPAWSSFTAVDRYVFTQEQRGDVEVVVCYDGETGKQCWINETPVRFDEAVSGAGPRATPTYFERQLYTTGATGIVQCLQADTGRTVWSRDLQKDTQAKLPVWGFSSSPLIVADQVIVFAGDPAGQSVIAYSRQGGEVLWAAGRGRMSYSSPQKAQLGERDVVLMLSEVGLEVFDPNAGNLIWTYDWQVQAMRIVQPLLLDDQQLILGEDYSGCRMIQVDTQSEAWSSRDVWSSTQLKPYFNDFVYYQGHCYGFDGKIFTCLDAATGQRRWKGGRFGFGQILLIEDMGALLLLVESGDVILLQATPEKLVELGRFHAISGKTWNHPVIAHDKLYVRSGEEAACYQLPVEVAAEPVASP